MTKARAERRANLKGTLLCALPADLVVDLWGVAERRGLSVSELAVRLLRILVRDGGVAAVLVGGFRRPAVPLEAVRNEPSPQAQRAARPPRGDRLPADLGEANELIRQLRTALIATDRPPQAMFTRTENAIVGMLLNRQIATAEALTVALYSDRPDDTPSSKNLDVLICKLRPKLKIFGVSIGTLRGEGWFLSAEHKRILRDAIWPADEARTA